MTVMYIILCLMGSNKAILNLNLNLPGINELIIRFEAFVDELCFSLLDDMSACYIFNSTLDRLKTICFLE